MGVGLRSVKAAEELAKRVEAEVINNHAVKPMDKRYYFKIGQKNRLCRNNRRASSGGEWVRPVSEILSQNHPAPMEIIGVKDRFGGIRRTERTLGKFGLKAKDIIEAVKSFEKKIRRK